MRTRLLEIVLAGLVVGCSPAFATSPKGATDTAKTEWKPVQDVFGFPGSLLPGNVIRFNMPRTDLHVTVAGVEVKSALALGA
jgi:hypothetical protein